MVESSEKPGTILKTQSNWENWILVIEMSALRYNVWDYINPDLEDPTLPTRPTIPLPSQVKAQVKVTPHQNDDDGNPMLRDATFTDLTANEKEYLKYLMDDFKYQRAEYDKTMDSLRRIRSEIQKSVEEKHAVVLKDPSPYNTLVFLRKRFKPNDYANRETLRAKWMNLSNDKGIQDKEEWTQSWLMTYEECKKINLPEVQGDYPETTFLRAIKAISPSFAGSYEVDLAKGKLTTFDHLIEEYRNWLRTQEATTIRHPKASVYAANLETLDSATPPAPSLGGLDKMGNARKCLCGGNHKFSKCYYLFNWNRPDGWTPDSETMKEVGVKRKIPKLQRTLENIQKKHEANLKASEDLKGQPQQVPRAAMAMALPMRTLKDTTTPNPRPSSSIYALANSFILDCGATNHVCNQRDRFTTFTPAQDVLVAGDSTVEIQGWGTAFVNFHAGGKTTKFELLNCAYIPTFTINLVAYRKLRLVGIKWNQEDMHLYYGNTLVGEIQVRHEQYCLEYHEISDYTAYSFRRSIQPKSKITWTMDQAHARMGDISQEALKHLPEVSADIETITGELTQPCETCRICDSKQIISRRSGEKGQEPFHRVCWDALYIKGGILSHFHCDFLGFSMMCFCVSTSAIELVSTFKRVITTARTQWGYGVKVFRIDGQPSLIESDEWHELVTQYGIQVEISAPDVHAQNGMAERSGGVIVNMARKLKHRSNLPMTVWKEILSTAVYILNRSPKRSLQWSTPLAKLQELSGKMNPKLRIGHLMPLGCRAYVLRKDIPRLEKLEPRAHIGYLVGYDSTNIFRIWIPKLNTVVRTRDATFDETRVYSPDDEFDDQVDQRVRTMELIDFGEGDEAEVYDDSFVPQPGEISLKEVSDTIIVDSGHGISHGESYDRSDQLITPALTPDRDIGHHDEKEANGRNTGNGELSPRPTESTKTTAYNTTYSAAFNVQYGDQRKRIHQSELPPPPKGWYDVQNHQYSIEFKQAAKYEMEELQKRQTFASVPEAATEGFVIPTKWVFTYKCDEEGYLVKFKARVVVRGDLQPPNGEETYAATLAIRIFRFLMALTSYFKLSTHQYDAVNAFPNAGLNRKVWIKFPPGFHVKGQVLLLMRALYGLRISPLLWHNLLCKVMGELGLKPIPECPCLFYSPQLIVFFYVDDIVVLYHQTNRSAFDMFHKGIMERFRLRDMGELKWFLGIRILRDLDQGLIWLCQDSQIEKLASKYGLKGKATTPFPTTPLVKNDAQASEARIKRYQQKVGAVGYLATITRPDCAKAHSKLAEFLRNPSTAHEEAIDQCILFLYHTKYQALEYGTSKPGAPVFFGASDASFADDPERRWSTEGFLFQLFGGTIDWKSVLQRTVTTSSTEAELLALSHIGSWMIWWRRLFDQMDFDTDSKDSILCDNRQTVRLMIKEAPKLVTKLKHVDIHQHWLRQESESGNISIEWIGTNEMPADGLTKSLGPQKHREFMKQLNMVDIRHRINTTME